MSRRVYAQCYRYIRETARGHGNMAEGNYLYQNHLDIYRAASASFVASAGDFSGWIHRVRKYHFFALVNMKLGGGR